MKFVVLALCVAVAYAISDLKEGHGVCSLCVRRNDRLKCCNGNTECSSKGGAVRCEQTIPRRDDGVRADVEYEREKLTRGVENFCTICCGHDSMTERCCSGDTSCTCTRNLLPSCY